MTAWMHFAEEMANLGVAGELLQVPLLMPAASAGAAQTRRFGPQVHLDPLERGEVKKSSK